MLSVIGRVSRGGAEALRGRGFILRVSAGVGAPTIAIKVQADGGIQITYTGRLQSTDSLTSSNWIDVANAANPFNTTATAPQRYDRTVSPLPTARTQI